MVHDPCCPLDDAQAVDCAVCTAIGEARGQEKAIFSQTWKANIGAITQRAYERGYRDAKCGATSDWTRW